MNRVRRVGTALFRFGKELNFYTANSTDQHEMQNGRIATRLYIILLFGSLTILTTYILSSYETHNIVITNPTLQVYEEINRKIEADKLACPCSKISINYGSFVSVRPTFSSDLCHPCFLINLGSISNLCQLARDTVNDARSQFYQSKWITAKMIPQDILQPGVTAIVLAQTSTTINNISSIIWSWSSDAQLAADLIQNERRIGSTVF